MKRRVFLKNTVAASLAFAYPNFSGNATLPELKNENSENSKKLKDRFWLWGQEPGSHHVNNAYNLPGENLMDPVEGCQYLGIDRCCRVSMGLGPFPPYDNEAEKLKHLKEVVWSGLGTNHLLDPKKDQSDLDEILRIAKIYPNVTGVVMDDFFRGKDTPWSLSYDYVQQMSERLHAFEKRRLDFWLVWYVTELDLDVGTYIDLFDVITLWTMKGSDLQFLDENMKKFISKTPGKRRLAGCYMWNYREKKPFTIEEMKYQLDRYYYWIKEKQIEGIIFCSNCNADLGLEAVEYTRRWIQEVGNEVI